MVQKKKRKNYKEMKRLWMAFPQEMWNDLKLIVEQESRVRGYRYGVSDYIRECCDYIMKNQERFEASVMTSASQDEHRRIAMFEKSGRESVWALRYQPRKSKSEAAKALKSLCKKYSPDPSQSL